MTKDEYLELLQGIKKKKDLYYTEIERIKKRTRDLSTETNDLTDRYIEFNSVYKIGDHVMFKHDNCHYYILAVSMTRDYEIIYSLTDQDIIKDLVIDGLMPSYLFNCPHPTVREDQLVNLSRETI